MKLNFNFKIKGLDGKEVQGRDEFTLASKLLGNMLSQLNTGNSIKLFDWASKLWNEGALELDETDSHVLEELINKCESLTVLAKVPMMKHIQSVREKSKK